MYDVTSIYGIMHSPCLFLRFLHPTPPPPPFHPFLCSFDEHSLIDLPTMLDYVIANTTQKKVFYIGHSQGTMMGFAGFSHNKTLASYIQKFYALALVVFVKYIKGLFEWIAQFYKPLAVRIHINKYNKRERGRDCKGKCLAFF